MTLHDVATVRTQKRELLLGFDAFGDDLQLEAVREGDDRFGEW